MDSSRPAYFRLSLHFVVKGTQNMSSESLEQEECTSPIEETSDERLAKETLRLPA